MTSRDFTIKELVFVIVCATLVAIGFSMLSGCTSVGPQGLRGEDGRQGPEGERGPPGSPGKNALGWQPLYQVACFATLDLLGPGDASDGIGETALMYEVMRYTNGDLDVYCEASIGAAQSGSGQRFYRSSSVGANDGPCYASANISAGVVGTTAGMWSFEAGRAAPYVKYSDADNPVGLNGFLWEFTERDCVASAMDERGEWTDVTLSELF